MGLEFVGHWSKSIKFTFVPHLKAGLPLLAADGTSLPVRANRLERRLQLSRLSKLPPDAIDGLVGKADDSGNRGVGRLRICQQHRGCIFPPLLSRWCCRAASKVEADCHRSLLVVGQSDANVSAH
jgi:hypothetical protein